MTKCIDPDTLNPGVRRTVAWLQKHGFDTCDSGDGETHEFECDPEWAYVAMTVTPADRLVSETERLGIDTDEPFDEEAYRKLVDLPEADRKPTPHGIEAVWLHLENPKVVWAGTGGYWREADINDVRLVEG